MSERRRFHTLDALRGIAALMIVFLHTSDISGVLQRRRSYLGVDLFFLLSGVVLAEAYRARLRSGLSPLAFLRIRLARLYPLYLLGTLLALVPVLGVLAGVGENVFHWTPASVALNGAAGLLMLPVLGHAALYPFLPAAWSLLYELVANMAWATGLRLGGGRTLRTALVVGGALGLLSLGLQHGDLDLGRDADGLSVLAALCRVSFSFGLGLILHEVDPKRLGQLPAWALLLITGLLLSMEPGGAWVPAYELFCILIAFPAIVLLARGSEPRTAWGRRLADALGRASYGLYMLHLGAYLVLQGACRKVLHLDLGLYAPYSGLAFAAALIAAVLWLDRVYDEPLRRRLSAAGGRR